MPATRPQSASPARSSLRRLFIPGLLELPEEWRGSVSIAAVAPTLSARMRTGALHVPDGDWRSRLGEVFGYGRVPVASLEMRGLGLDPGEAHWVRVDPVCMRAGLDTAMMIPAGLMALDMDEAQALAESLASLVGGDERILCPRPDRWYLRLDEPLDVAVVDSVEAAGRDLRAVMPTGPDARRLDRLLTEVQMLFHDHAVNRERGSRGQPPVNGIWVWGGGRWTAPGGGQGEDLLWTDEPLAAGLAGCGLSAGTAPGPDACARPGSLVWTAPARHGLAADRDAWEADLAIAEALVRGAGPEMSLDLGHLVLDHRSGDRLRFWRRLTRPGRASGEEAWIRWRRVG